MVIEVYWNFLRVHGVGSSEEHIHTFTVPYQSHWLRCMEISKKNEYVQQLVLHEQQMKKKISWFAI